MRHHSLTIWGLAGLLLLTGQTHAQSGAMSATGASSTTGPNSTTGARGANNTPLDQPSTQWPKTIMTSGGTVINLYQPQVLAYDGSTMRSRSVIAVLGRDDDDPLFGVAWMTANVAPDSSGEPSASASGDTSRGASGGPSASAIAIRSVNVDELEMTGDTDQSDKDFITAAMEVYMPWVVKSLPLADIEQSLEQGRRQEALARDTSGRGLTVLYETKPSVLVLIDGEPRLAMNAKWGLNTVVNTRFLIVQGKDNQYYYYGGARWYVAPAATGPYAVLRGKLSRELKKVEKDLKKAARKDDLELGDLDGAPVYQVVVSTAPAVLIQSDGKAEPVPIAGTALTYVNNSGNDIFFDTATRQYYTLVSGQWYRSASLEEVWAPEMNRDLPGDFARIPASSPKAGVMSAVDGTAEEKAARRDEQVPETVKVSRDVSTVVDYDGAPRFKPIIGTGLDYATNTCSIVLRADGGRQFYTLDNGVWFIASSAIGIWRVSDTRTPGAELIPRQYAAYRAKFVYIYQTAPDYVYEGYLPGYTDIADNGCALAESYDPDWADETWGFDLDFVFGFGGGWYDGWYWFDGRRRYYGYVSYAGGGGVWKGKSYGKGGSWNIYAPGERVRPPHTPGNWHPRPAGQEVARGRLSGQGSTAVQRAAASGGYGLAGGSRGFASTGSRGVVGSGGSRGLIGPGAPRAQVVYGGARNNSGSRSYSSGGGGVSSGGGGGGGAAHTSGGGGGSTGGGGASHH